jgi:hypothetical protein
VKKWNKHGNRDGDSGKLDAVGTLLRAPFFTASTLARCVTRAELLAASLAPPLARSWTDFACPICLEVLRNPVVLSCAHRFCFGCVATAALYAPERPAFAPPSAPVPRGLRCDCPVCRKRFRTEAQWANHERSRKHVEALAALRAQLQEEERRAGPGSDAEQERAEERTEPQSGSGSDDDDDAGRAGGARGGTKAARKKAAKAAKRMGRAQARAPSSSEEERDEAADELADALASKARVASPEVRIMSAASCGMPRRSIWLRTTSPGRGFVCFVVCLEPWTGSALS